MGPERETEADGGRERRSEGKKGEGIPMARGRTSRPPRARSRSPSDSWLTVAFIAPTSHGGSRSTSWPVQVAAAVYRGGGGGGPGGRTGGIIVTGMGADGRPFGGSRRVTVSFEGAAHHARMRMYARARACLHLLRTSIDRFTATASNPLITARSGTGPNRGRFARAPGRNQRPALRAPERPGPRPGVLIRG